MEIKSEMELTITDIFAILMKRFWIIALCLIVGALGSFAATKLLIDKEYTSSVSMYVEPNIDEANIQALLYGLDYSKGIVKTYVKILNTEAFMDSVMTAAEMSYSMEDINNMVEINAFEGTDIFEVKVTTNSPQESLKLAQTIADLAPQQIMEIKDAAAVRIVDPAKLPEKPSGPSVRKNTAIGLLAGIVLGILAVFFIENMDKRIKNEDDLYKRYQVPLIGVVPLSEELNFSVIEAYKTTRTNMMFTLHNSGCNRIIITSGLPKDGKSTICYNLGLSLVQMESKVLIIDCDMRKPTMHRLFKTKAVPGLSEVLAGMNPVEQSLRHTEHSNLDLICAGTIPPNPLELLGGGAMKELLGKLSEEYDYILMDTPPTNLVADALALSTNADGTVLVARQGQTTYPELNRALQSLKFANAKLLGMILNGVPSSERFGYKYGHGRYGEYYGEKS